MAPVSIPADFVATLGHGLTVRAVSSSPLTEDNTREQTIVEAWAEGYHVGSIIILFCIVMCNYRRHVLLHKLIILELALALGHGIFIFFNDPVYGWVLSTTATLLYISYTVHNVVAWMKIKPFLPKWGVRVFILTLAAVQPYWVLETWANFEYFNVLGSTIFEQTRLWESLMRDPWWIFTSIKLVLVINKNYNFTIPQLVRISPRFGVMLLCVFISVVFLIIDAVITATISTQSGINPYWRFAFVFKCAADVIFLDDFKSVLDHISHSAMRRYCNFPSQSVISPRAPDHFDNNYFPYDGTQQIGVGNRPRDMKKGGLNNWPLESRSGPEWSHHEQRKKSTSCSDKIGKAEGSDRIFGQRFGSQEDILGGLKRSNSEGQDFGISRDIPLKPVRAALKKD